MDKAEGGRRKTRTLLSYNLRNLDQSNCCVIQYNFNKYGKREWRSNLLPLYSSAPSLVIICLNQVMAMLALPSKQRMIMEAGAVADWRILCQLQIFVHICDLIAAVALNTLRALISHFPKQTNSPTSSVPILAVELTFVPHMSALSDYFKDLRPPVKKVGIHVNVCTRQGLILLRKKFLQTANFP